MGGIIYNNSTQWDWLGVLSIFIGVLILLHLFLRRRPVAPKTYLTWMVIIGIIGLVIAWMNKPNLPAPAIEDSIDLILVNTAEWGKPELTDIALRDGLKMEGSFIPGYRYPFSFAVVHGIPRTTLTGAKVIITVREDVAFQPTHPHAWEPARSIKAGTKSYVYTFVEGIHSHAGKPLLGDVFLIFPKADTYTIGVGLAGDGFNAIARSVTMRLLP